MWKLRLRDINLTKEVASLSVSQPSHGTVKDCKCCLLMAINESSKVKITYAWQPIRRDVFSFTYWLIMYLISPCQILLTIFVRHSLSKSRRKNLFGFKVEIKACQESNDYGIKKLRVYLQILMKWLTDEVGNEIIQERLRIQKNKNLKVGGGP